MSRSVQYDNQFVQYVGMSDEQHSSASTPATFSYVAAPSYDTPYVYPASSEVPLVPTTAAESRARVSACQRRRNRCKRNRILRLPVLMLVVSTVLSVMALTHSNWFKISMVTQQTADDGTQVITVNKSHFGLFSGATTTTVFPALTTTETAAHCGPGLPCKQLHTTAGLYIAATALAGFALIAAFLDRCGCFGATRKVWLAPVLAMLALGLHIAVVVLAAKAMRHHGHHDHHHEPNPDESSSLISVERNMGCSFYSACFALMSTAYAFLALCGHACRTRCAKFRREQRRRQAVPNPAV